jgi:hypothetical protein
MSLFPLLRLSLPGLVLAALALTGCAETVTVTVPPRVELGAFPMVGLLEFSAKPPGELGAAASQKLLANLHAAQPGLRVLELGSRERVLQEVGRAELDAAAVQAIGRRYGVEALLWGTVELSEPRPDLSVAPDLKAVSAQAKIDGRMSAKLWETGSGATVWANSSWGSWRVAGMSLSGRGVGGASFSHPGEQRDNILLELVKALNGDFWPTYERRKVED